MVRLTILFGGLTASSAAMAQSSPSLGPTREEVERRQPTTQPATPRVEIEGELARAPCALDSADYAQVRFTLRAVTFDGLRGLDPTLLRDAYASYTGRDNPVSVVCDIRDRASKILRDAGYIAAVQVPEQSLAAGDLKLDVVLARLVGVRVRGNAGHAENLIAGYLNRLNGQPVFNRFEAERYLLLASDIPGYYVRLALRPAGTSPGEVVGEVTVQRMPLSVDANISNYGSKELGRTGGLLRAQLFGLTGLGDVTRAAIFVTQDPSEQKTLQLGHEFRVGSEGLTVAGSFDYSWARPDIDGPDNVRARTMVASASVGYPLIRSLARSLSAAAGLDVSTQRVWLDGSLLNRDRIRVGFARLTYDSASQDFHRPGYSAAEPVWRLGGTVELRHGLRLLGASHHCDPTCVSLGGIPTSREDADMTAGVGRAYVYGEFRPDPKLTLALNLRGQYSSRPLVTFEQFAAGNYTVGRGSDPGALLGDRGLGAQTEMRFGSLIPKNAHTPAAQPYLFWDIAKVANEDPLFLPRGQRHLSSVGVGVRASLFSFDLESAVAVPLVRTGFADERPAARFLFSVTKRLWPWGS